MVKVYNFRNIQSKCERMLQAYLKFYSHKMELKVCLKHSASSNIILKNVLLTIRRRRRGRGKRHRVKRYTIFSWHFVWKELTVCLQHSFTLCSDIRKLLDLNHMFNNWKTWRSGWVTYSLWNNVFIFLMTTTFN